ncbi:MAG: hypothetical protein HKN18_13700 [Silicimonas sp.]|nr:hypothetical protein [Silicimonas sp.]
MKLGEVRALTADEWRALLEQSPQNTVFLNPEFLALFGVEVRFWGLERKGVVIAGLPVIEAQALGSRFLPWCYYQGIVLHREIWRAARAKRTQYEIEILEELATSVAEVEPRFHLSLHPSLMDVRGLDWVHYHTPDRPRVQLAPRYTAVQSTSSETSESLRKAARSARRQEEGYAQSREGLTLSQDGTLDELVGLLRDTFDRQNTGMSETEARLLPVYTSYLLAEVHGAFLTVRNAEGAAVAMALTFADVDGTIHVPIVGTGNTRFGGTLLYFAILDHALSTGAPAVDFNGANSPSRAYFKHSIGARPVLFFEASYDAVNGK